MENFSKKFFPSLYKRNKGNENQLNNNNNNISNDIEENYNTNEKYNLPRQGIGTTELVSTDASEFQKNNQDVNEHSLIDLSDNCKMEKHMATLENLKSKNRENKENNNNGDINKDLSKSDIKSGDHLINDSKYRKDKISEVNLKYDEKEAEENDKQNSNFRDKNKKDTESQRNQENKKNNINEGKYDEGYEQMENEKKKINKEKIKNMDKDTNDDNSKTCIMDDRNISINGECIENMNNSKNNNIRKTPKKIKMKKIEINQNKKEIGFTKQDEIYQIKEIKKENDTNTYSPINNDINNSIILNANDKIIRNENNIGNKSVNISINTKNKNIIFNNNNNDNTNIQLIQNKHNLTYYYSGNNNQNSYMTEINNSKKHFSEFESNTYKLCNATIDTNECNNAKIKLQTIYPSNNINKNLANDNMLKHEGIKETFISNINYNNFPNHTNINIIDTIENTPTILTTDNNNHNYNQNYYTNMFNDLNYVSRLNNNYISQNSNDENLLNEPDSYNNFPFMNTKIRSLGNNALSNGHINNNIKNRYNCITDNNSNNSSNSNSKNSANIMNEFFVYNNINNVYKEPVSNNNNISNANTSHYSGQNFEHFSMGMNLDENNMHASGALANSYTYVNPFNGDNVFTCKNMDNFINSNISMFNGNITDNMSTNIYMNQTNLNFSHFNEKEINSNQQANDDFINDINYNDYDIYSVSSNYTQNNNSYSIHGINNISNNSRKSFFPNYNGNFNNDRNSFLNKNTTTNFVFNNIKRNDNINDIFDEKNKLLDVLNSAKSSIIIENDIINNNEFTSSFEKSNHGIEINENNSEKTKSGFIFDKKKDHSKKKTCTVKIKKVNAVNLGGQYGLSSNGETSKDGKSEKNEKDGERDCNKTNKANIFDVAKKKKYIAEIIRCELIWGPSKNKEPITPVENCELHPVVIIKDELGNLYDDDEINENNPIGKTVNIFYRWSRGPPRTVCFFHSQKIAHIQCTLTFRCFCSYNCFMKGFEHVHKYYKSNGSINIPSHFNLHTYGVSCSSFNWENYDENIEFDEIHYKGLINSGLINISGKETWKVIHNERNYIPCIKDVGHQIMLETMILDKRGITSSSKSNSSDSCEDNDLENSDQEKSYTKFNIDKHKIHENFDTKFVQNPKTQICTNQSNEIENIQNNDNKKLNNFKTNFIDNFNIIKEQTNIDKENQTSISQNNITQINKIYETNNTDPNISNVDDFQVSSTLDTIEATIAEPYSSTRFSIPLMCINESKKNKLRNINSDEIIEPKFSEKEGIEEKILDSDENKTLGLTTQNELTNKNKKDQIMNKKKKKGTNKKIYVLDDKVWDSINDPNIYHKIITGCCIPNIQIMQNNNNVTSFKTLNSSNTSDNQFTVMTWNILAEIYGTSEAFAHCDPYMLSWSYRKTKIIQEILNYRPDIICLQEIQNEHFLEFFKPCLSQYEYQGVYKQKTKEIFTSPSGKHKGGKYTIDGCAIFFNKKKFKFVEIYALEFSKLIKEGSVISLPKEVQKNPALSKGLLKDNIALVLLLEHVENNKIYDSEKWEKNNNPRFENRKNKKKVVIVANTHIIANPEATYVKIWQTQILVKVIEYLKINFIQKYEIIPSIIICGDFNSTPNSAVYQLLYKKKCFPTHHDINSDEHGLLEYLPMSHNLNLKSAYAISNFLSQTINTEESINNIIINNTIDLDKFEPPFTNYTSNFIGCLDYIFYNDEDLNIISTVNIPDENQLIQESQIYHLSSSALPSPIRSSDHFPLIAKFEFKFF
ncbi:carbon catabolite repressor protein 4, putative [Plasmodium berghei]|uniref:Carbon catabolite repressor protein 4, putative n=1 Tax=Plasmodium berghei TaxID=5821 RepID=A0A122IL04_PLABE|nr:carbon catabolite repressor protein 4, putative [Plasmodium berghei]